jgi:hypothetical protein
MKGLWYERGTVCITRLKHDLIAAESFLLGKKLRFFRHIKMAPEIGQLSGRDESGYGSPGKNNHDIPGCDGAWDFPDTNMKFSFYSHQQEIFSIGTICVKEREG